MHDRSQPGTQSNLAKPVGRALLDLQDMCTWRIHFLGLLRGCPYKGYEECHIAAVQTDLFQCSLRWRASNLAKINLLCKIRCNV